MTLENTIRVKAMCLLIQDGFILVANGSTMKSKVRLVIARNFYRVMGGSMEINETAEETVRREIREELNSEIENLERLDVVENIYTYEGHGGHEIVFMFKGELANKELRKQDKIHVVDADYEFDAVWVPVKELLNGDKPLYPSFDYSRFI
jgi:ADP-ribose pyrophosphatase YjhB (NUDIX family)